MKFFGYYFDDYGLLHYEPEDDSAPNAPERANADTSEAKESTAQNSNDDDAVHGFRRWLENWLAVSPEDRMHIDYLAHIRRLSDPDTQEDHAEAEAAATLP